MNRRAFTFIEVLVVLTITCFLAALILPVVSSAKERGRMVQCANNLRQLSMAHLAFAQDNSGNMCTANDALTTEPPGWLAGTPVPTVVTNSILIQRKMITSKELFHCPSDAGVRTDPGAIQPPLFSYARNGEILQLFPDPASQVQPKADNVRYPGKTMLLMELDDSHPFNDGSTMRWLVDKISGRHLGMGGMSFFDGHAVMMKADEYNSLDENGRLDAYLYPPE